MAVTIWYDYTCGYCYRFLHWVDAVQAERPGVEIEWAAFSRKDYNRPDGEPSVLTGDEPMSVSVLAFALAHAAREGGDFAAYHHAVYEAMHAPGHGTVTADDLRAIAVVCGVDLAAFDDNVERWRASVAAEHARGRDVHHVFGTPTMIYPGGESAFVKLDETPSTEDAGRLWDALEVLSVCHPELVEIKRASPS